MLKGLDVWEHTRLHRVLPVQLSNVDNLHVKIMNFILFKVGAYNQSVINYTALSEYLLIIMISISASAFNFSIMYTNVSFLVYTCSTF